LQKGGVLVLVVQILNDADKLDAYAEVVDALVLVERDGDLPLDVFSVLHFWIRFKINLP